MRDEAWVRLLPADPRPWLLASDEPAARWLTLTALLDRAADDPEVEEAHRSVLADPRTEDLLGRLGDWEEARPLSGHDSPAWAANLLVLLHEMGLRTGEDPRVDRVLEAMLRHQDASGRFQTYARSRATPEPAWFALLCDTHAIADVLVRYGFGEDPRVAAAIERMLLDTTATTHGTGWPCVAVGGFRGPGRKSEHCPQVTVEALRVLALLPRDRRPTVADDAVRTTLATWRARGSTRPYMFGHGARFKAVKWPPTWYSSLTVLEAVADYADVWSGAGADPADRRSVAELAACLVAYNVGADGRVTPRSCFRGFEAFSFGQKREPSAWATARVCTALRRFEALEDDIASVDVLALSSSKGGSGTARPPRPA